MSNVSRREVVLVQSFLTCYSYGMGGIWFLLKAPSYIQAKQAYPEFAVFETKPDWMTEEDEEKYRSYFIQKDRVWNVEIPPSGWFKGLVDEVRKG